MVKSSLLVVLLLKLIEVKRQHASNIAEKFPTECTTPNGRKGWCIEIQKCTKFITQIEQNNSETFAFIKQSQCGPLNEDPLGPKVCCGDDISFRTEFPTECTTPNGGKGWCIEIQKCTKFITQIEQNNSETFAFIKQSQCGPLDEDPLRPKVCCGDDINFRTEFPTECTTPNGGKSWCIEIQKCTKFITQIKQNNSETFAFIKQSQCGPLNEDPLRPKVCCGDDINFRTEESCVTPNGENATCVSIYECNTFLRVLSTADALGMQFLQASVCRMQGKLPIVCCGTSTKYESRKPSSLLPGRDICGIQEDQFKVFGCENTGITEFPWMAALQYRNGTGHLSFKCAGALISERYVLTAAHCVQTPTLTLTGVRLGEWNLDTPIDCDGKGKYIRCINPPIDAEVEEIKYHDSYTRTTKGVFYDIALLRLRNPITYIGSVRPICLPKPNESTPAGTILEVSGWGTTENAKYSPIKKKVGLPIMEPSQCQSLFGSKGLTVTNAHICAGGVAGMDSCKGDSGGPLMATVATKPSQYYAEGVVSYGFICGSAGYPGIYTKVADYLDWINDNIRP